MDSTKGMVAEAAKEAVGKVAEKIEKSIINNITSSLLGPSSKCNQQQNDSLTGQKQGKSGSNSQTGQMQGKPGNNSQKQNTSQTKEQQQQKKPAENKTPQQNTSQTKEQQQQKKPAENKTPQQNTSQTKETQKSTPAEIKKIKSTNLKQFFSSQSSTTMISADANANNAKTTYSTATTLVSSMDPLSSCGASPPPVLAICPLLPGGAGATTLVSGLSNDGKAPTFALPTLLSSGAAEAMKKEKL